MRDFIKRVKAVSDPNRVRILFALKQSELCVCQIRELLKLAPSTVSKHLSLLHDARLIEGRKDGRWMYYRLPGDDSDPVIKDMLDWIFGAASEIPETRADGEQLTAILGIPLDVICKEQTGHTHGSRRY